MQTEDAPETTATIGLPAQSINDARKAFEKEVLAPPIEPGTLTPGS